VDSFHKKNPDYTIIHDNLKNMKDVTSSQTYQKGSWVLHMLRGVLGTKIFWKGIKSYYLKYKDLNASTADFKKVMEEVSGINLTTFFNQWLYQPGVLKLEAEWYYDKSETELVLEINQVQDGKILIEMPIEIGFNYEENKQKIEKIQLSGAYSKHRIKLENEPINISLDPNLLVLMNNSIKKIEIK